MFTVRQLCRVGLVLACVVAMPGAALASENETVGDDRVSDALGTREANVMGAPEDVEEAQPTSSAAYTAAAYCAPYFPYGGGFTTSLGGGWSSLAARSEPCRAAPSRGTWHTGQTFWVSRETRGEFICRGRYTYGYGSSIWYRTRKGWSWSGGTSNPQWNQRC